MSHIQEYRRGRYSKVQYIQTALQKLRTEGEDEFTVYDVLTIIKHAMTPRELAMRLRLNQIELGIRKTGKEVPIDGDASPSWTWREE